MARRAALFLTCAVDALYPSVGLDAAGVLERLGVEVVFRNEQTCCGQPWINSGDPENGRRHALAFLATHEKEEAVVMLSSSCADTVRNAYPALFDDDPALCARFRALAGRTWEFCEYIHKVLGVEQFPAHPSPGPVTYHSSCRTLRGTGLRGVVEKYLEAMMGAHFVPLPENDRCCGFGGSFSVKFPELSGRIMEDKLRNIASTGARTVASLDLSCLTHLKGGAQKKGSPEIRFVHLAELMREALAGDAG